MNLDPYSDTENDYYESRSTNQLSTSVPDPWHFGVDPDPRIQASD